MQNNMKQIHKILTLFIGAFFLMGLTTLAQESKEDIIKVKIETEENGVKKVFEKTYSSEEEMNQDQELKDLGFEGFDESEFETMASKKPIEETEDIQIDIRGDDEGEQVKVRKVIKDKNGKEKVIEKVYNSLEEMEADEDMEVDVMKKGDQKEIIIKKEKVQGKKDKMSKTVEMEIEETDEGSDKKVEKKTIEIIKKEKEEKR